MSPNPSASRGGEPCCGEGEGRPILLYLDKKRVSNPRKLRIFLAEKGLDVPTKELDLYASEQKTPEFRALNPFAVYRSWSWTTGRC